MPILHTQLTGQVKTPDGTMMDVPSQIVLAQRGSHIQVTVALALSIAEHFLQQGHVVPQPVSGWALIDTGASTTCIDNVVAQQMQLPIIDVVQISSASHAATQQNVYAIHVEVISSPISIDTDRAIGATLGAQGLLLLLGRDVLQHCTLFYNGLTGQLILSL